MFKHKKITIKGKEYYQTIYVNKHKTKSYYLNGKCHREDGPAVESAAGSKFWYIKDKLHREDGPAVEYISGTKEWWQNDQLHRLDGPAIEVFDGTKELWINDVKYTKEEYNKLCLNIKKI